LLAHFVQGGSFVVHRATLSQTP